MSIPGHIDEITHTVTAGAAQTNLNIYGYFRRNFFWNDWNWDVYFSCTKKEWVTNLTLLEHKNETWSATLNTSENDTSQPRKLIQASGSILNANNSWRMTYDLGQYTGGAIPRGTKFWHSAAIVAHEKGHADEFKRASEEALFIVTNYLDTKTLEHVCGLTKQEAKAQLESLISKDDVKDQYKETTMSLYKRHSEIDPELKQLEGAILTPLRNALIVICKANDWLYDN